MDPRVIDLVKDYFADEVQEHRSRIGLTTWLMRRLSLAQASAEDLYGRLLMCGVIHEGTTCFRRSSAGTVCDADVCLAEGESGIIVAARAQEQASRAVEERQTWKPSHELVWLPADGNTPMRWLVMLVPDPFDEQRRLAFTKRDWVQNRAPAWEYDLRDGSWSWRGKPGPGAPGGKLEVREVVAATWNGPPLE